MAATRKLAPLISALGDDAEGARRLPPQLLAALHKVKLFRLALPRSVGGLEVDPMTYIEVMHLVARADASTAWCLGQAAGCAMSAAYLDPDVLAEVFGSPDAVLAWGFPVKAQAVALDAETYSVSGTWQFNSGAHHATWVGAHAAVVERDGSPRLTASGRPVERTFLVPATEIEWTDDWHVIGLRGTGSEAFTLVDRVVAHDHSVPRDWEQERREGGDLYRLSYRHMFQVGFAAVALGVARATLDAFMDLARTKVPRGSPSALRDNHVVQLNTAKCEARLSSAWAYLVSATEQTWDSIRSTRFLDLEHRMLLRLASTYTIHEARDVVNTVWDAAGATVIFDGNAMERRFRDMHTITQQLQGRSAFLEAVGAHLLGSEADTTFI